MAYVDDTVVTGGDPKEVEALGKLNLDYALRREEPPAPTDASSQVEVALYERWEKSNRLSMMFIKSRISASIRGSIPDCRNVKDYMKAIDEHFESSSKALASTLMTQLSSMRLTGVRGVREHVMRLRDIAAQLKALEVEISDSFLVHLILNSLPVQYRPFKISYNTHKEKWSINELLMMSVQEEGTLIQELGESALLVTNEGFHKEKETDRKGTKHLYGQSDVFTCGSSNNIPFSLVVMHGNGMNEKFSMLWHRRLGHISIERMKKLLSDGVLEPLDFTDFDTCVDCIKGKQTKRSQKGAKRSSDILEIIHTDICCPDMSLSEKQYGKQIKIVRSDRGGEFYGRYTGSGQILGLFAKYLQEDGIVAQYTMPGTPNQNGVAERRNRTLLDMVRSMLSNSNLPLSLWSEVLKIVRVYNPQERKLDPRTRSAYFIGYAEKSKGYKFYCPSYSSKIVESTNARFLEHDMESGRNHPLKVVENDNVCQTSPCTRVIVQYNAHTDRVNVEQPITNVPHHEDNVQVDHMMDDQTPHNENVVQEYIAQEQL
nr:uncharacterized protein LOC112795464 [Arachis hypogaea]